MGYYQYWCWYILKLSFSLRYKKGNSQNEKKTLSFIFSILAIGVVLYGFFQSVQYSKIYEQEPSIIVKQQKIQTTWSSIHILSNELKFSSILFCGNDAVGKIYTDNDTKINIISKNQFGDVKVLFQKKDTNHIIVKELTQKQNQIDLESAEYQIFIVGKFFTGSIYVTSDDISFYK